MTERPHKNLKVWQKSIVLAKEIYKITEEFPNSEKFGLVSQMRRAVISIPSNIAEGAARNSDKEKLQFYYTARGSLSELDTQLELSKEIGFIKENEKNRIYDNMNEVSILLNGLIKSQRGRNEKE